MCLVDKPSKPSIVNRGLPGPGLSWLFLNHLVRESNPDYQTGRKDTIFFSLFTFLFTLRLPISVCEKE